MSRRERRSSASAAACSCSISTPRTAACRRSRSPIWPEYEGNAGTTVFQVLVTMSEAAEDDVTFKWGTTALTATGGVDFVEVPVPAGDPNGTIAAGDTSTMLTVNVNGETFEEDNETFLINLSSVSPNATFFDPQATITILDDDRPPAISIADMQVVEGDAGLVDMIFQLTTTRPVAQVLSVNYATQDGTATTADNDYQSASGIATFASMSTSTTVTVHVVGDTDDEQDESFVVNLSGPAGGAVIADGQATGTIYDDDGFLTFIEAEILPDIDTLWGVSGLAISPSGQHLYATGQFADAIAIFTRNPVSGELTYVDSVSDGDDQGGLTIDGLDGAGAIVVSPDGAHVYAAGFNEGAVSVFSRDPGTGLLTYVENKRDLTLGGTVSGLLGPSSLALSEDGAHLYVSSFTSDAVVKFDRDTNSGNPTFGMLSAPQTLVDGNGGVDGLNGAMQVRLSPGGAHVYVAGSVDNAIAIFSRNGATGELTYLNKVVDGLGANGLEGVAGIAVSIDGGEVYAAGAGEDALATFGRDDATGLLTFESMFVDGVNGIDGLDGVRRVEVSFDGRFVYAAGYLDDTLAVFARNVDTGVISPLELHRDGFGGENGLARISALAVSADDQHIYGAGQDDDAIAVFMRDSLAPAGPMVLESTSHTPGVFSNDTTVDITWSGAADNPGGSGLAGYSIVFDATALTVPDTIVDVPQTSDPHGTTSPQLPDGTSYYFHIRTCDLAGNCSLTQHLGAYFIDATAPVNPTAILSTSHQPAPTPNVLREITMNWNPGTDPLSGVAGYSFFFDDSASAVCDEIQDGGPGTLSTVSSTLADGSWYFHLCTVDVAGNWSSVATAGPYIIEAAPPTVLSVETVASTDDGLLTNGEIVSVPLTQFVVTFSEPVADPPGNGGADDVTNPANYQLLTPGPDGTFQTTDCTALLGDDTVLLPSSVLYFAASRESVAKFGPNALPAANYRLQICGSTSIVDLFANPIDGDGNGTGGDDYKLDFFVLSTNLLQNPNFDSSISGWIPTPATPGVVRFEPADADGWSISGSVIMELTGSNPAYGVSRCVTVDEDFDYVLGGRVRIGSASVTEPEAFAEAQYYASTNCTVTPLGTEQFGGTIAGDTAAAWLDLPEAVQVPPPGARSAFVSFVVLPGTVGDFDATFDRLYFQPTVEAVVFTDSFESGDFSQWDQHNP
ncbi:MAG: beta-propeller fold lactonase family protein [Thermoanaerobaculia bacterium]